MSIKPGSDVPQLREELDRKVMEALEWLQHAQATARISDAQASVAVDAVFKAVSGLVDEKFTEIITNMSALYDGVPKLVRVLLNANKVVKFEWGIGLSRIEVVVYTDGKESTRQIKEYDTPAEAKAAADKSIAKLKSLGYIQL